MSRLFRSVLVWGGISIFLSVLLLGCFSDKPSKSQTAQKVVLKLGTETASGSPETKGAQKLAELVREKSRGTLEIEVYENARLGTMRERNEGMRMGTIDMGTSSVGFLANYEPVMGIFDLPYIYKDKAHEMRVFDGEIGREVAFKLQERGLRVLCYFDAGARQITNNLRPINLPADLKGMRIRVPQSEASFESFKAFGAFPAQMAFGEIYTSLQKNIVTGQENPISLIIHNNFYEVQKYLSITNHQLFIQVLMISEKTWAKLSSDQQRILLEAAKEAQDYERDLAVKEETEGIRVLKEKGMQINEVTDIEEFITLSKNIQEIYSKRLGEPGKELFEKIQKLR